MRAALEPLRRPGAPLRLWIACSGGPDSVALLGLLHTLADGDRLVLGAGHVDHGLRVESSAEAASVQRLAQRLGVRVEVATLALPPGAGMPARARAARRAALAAQARAAGADVIAVGHTATDRAETLLLHLTRGAGLDGLSAMGVVDRDALGTWVRPLLELTREETAALCGRLQLPYVEDPTNLDLAHPRVALRREVLPRLSALRPNADLAIAAAAASVREARDAIEAMSAAQLRDRLEGDRLRAGGLCELPRAIRTRVVRSVCVRAGVDPDHVGRHVIADIDRALHEPAGPRSWALARGFRVHLDRRYLWVDPPPEDGSPPPGSMSP